MNTYFISFDTRDRNIAHLVVTILRENNPRKTFFFSNDSLLGGKVWSTPIIEALAKADAIVCLVTNKKSGVNNWLNFEVGAAIGGGKSRIILVHPKVASTDLSTPFQQLQYIKCSDRPALERELRKLELDDSTGTIDQLQSAVEHPSIVSAAYGEGSNWFILPDYLKGRYLVQLEDGKELTIGNHLLPRGEADDPSVGHPKHLKLVISRTGEQYERIYTERSKVRYSDLWREIR